jgi:hypothetical protein
VPVRRQSKNASTIATNIYSAYLSAMPQVSQLFVYPIKSLGGISLETSEVAERGLKHDRRWMLVDDQNEFMTQRSLAEMALLQVGLQNDGITVSHKIKNQQICIPFNATGPTTMVQVWSSRCRAIVADEKVNQWFSDSLSTSCKLVYMPDTTMRRVDGRYAFNKEVTAFTDDFPFLLIGQSSLDDLNGRLASPLSINRFRPNIVFTGGLPFEEDGWVHFSISNINFYGVKLCARCVVTTINQENGEKGKEPLKTLASYRQLNNKIYFGQNLLHHGEGVISVGDSINVLERKQPKINYSLHNSI